MSSICAVVRCKNTFTGVGRFCSEHHEAYKASPEKRRADTAMADFVRRIEAEALNGGRAPELPPSLPEQRGLEMSDTARRREAAIKALEDGIAARKTPPSNPSSNGVNPQAPETLP